MPCAASFLIRIDFFFLPLCHVRLEAICLWWSAFKFQLEIYLLHCSIIILTWPNTKEGGCYKPTQAHNVPLINDRHMPIVAALDKEIKTASGINTKIFDSKLETCHLDL